MEALRHEPRLEAKASSALCVQDGLSTEVRSDMILADFTIIDNVSYNQCASVFLTCRMPSPVLTTSFALACEIRCTKRTSFAESSLLTAF